MSFVNRRYTKRVPFLLKMACKRILWTGGGKGSGPSSYNTLLSAPLAHLGNHYVPQGEAVCSFSACYCHILCFLHFLVFNWNASIFLASKSSVRSSIFTKSIKFRSCDTSRVSLRPIKTFLHDKPRRKFFPWKLVRGNLSNFVKNLQTSSCFYRSDNHGLTQSSHEVFLKLCSCDEIIVKMLPRGCIFVAEFLKFR